MNFSNISRRRMIKSCALVGSMLPVAGLTRLRAEKPSSQLNIGFVGVGGRGYVDLMSVTEQATRHNVVALCDIDFRHGGEQPPQLGPAQLARPLGLGEATHQFPRANVFADYREMFDRVADQLDAVVVSTPDHMHAVIALEAMRLGKHVYVQKPLTQTVHEARVMTQVAKERGLITQMGTQYHSSPGYRTLVEVIQEGTIGRVREVHAWTAAPRWPQGIERPPGRDPVPEGVHWDLWLGAAEPRPYKKHTYHNFNWRGWHEFGTGSMGDMGCHIMDPAAWALELGAPRSVRAEVSDRSPETYPASSNVSFDFSPTRYTASDGLSLTWYDGGRRPPLELFKAGDAFRIPNNGSLFIGEKGNLVTSHHPSAPRLYPAKDFEDYSRTRLREIFKSQEPLDHYEHWTQCVLENRPANSDFSYAGPLTETVMLGTIAQRIPNETLAWDPVGLRFPQHTAATKLVRRDQYRAGFEAPELA